LGAVKGTFTSIHRKGREGRKGKTKKNNDPNAKKQKPKIKNQKEIRPKFEDRALVVLA